MNSTILIFSQLTVHLECVHKTFLHKSTKIITRFLADVMMTWSWKTTPIRSRRFWTISIKLPASVRNHLSTNTHTYTHKYPRPHKYTLIHTHFACTNRHTRFIHLNIYIYTRTYMHARIHAYINEYTHTYTHIYIYACTHTFI